MTVRTVRESVTEDMVESLITDVIEITESLQGPLFSIPKKFDTEPLSQRLGRSSDGGDIQIYC